MPVTLAPGAPVNLGPNARAPLADWALPLQQRARFAERGRGPDAFDCLGIALFVQNLLGRPVRSYAELYADLDIAADAAKPDIDALIRAENEAWRNVEAGAVGDVLVLGHGGHAHHVGVLCGAGRLLHAHKSRGVRIEEIEGRRAVKAAAGLKVFAVVRPS